MYKPFINKSFLFILLTGLCIGFTDPETGITDLAKYRLKGSVKSMMETRYALAGDTGSAVRDKITYQRLISFDKYGYETESTLYKDGASYLHALYLMGDEGRQIEMNEYHPDQTLNLNVTYNYDEKGFRTEALYHWADNREIGDFTGNTDYFYEVINNDIFTRVIFKNEYRGYCTEENYLKADSSLSFKFAYKYDFRGNKLESAYYHGGGRLSWLTKYKYDRYDNLIESRVYKSNYIAVHSGYGYQFDLVGNWVLRKEKREVYENILTAGLDRANTVTERIFEYY